MITTHSHYPTTIGFRGKLVRSPGFTLFEVILVLVLVAIVGAVVIGSFVGSDEIQTPAQRNLLQNRLRYAQIMAMKENTFWGLHCSANQYALVRNGITAADRRTFPGENTNLITVTNGTTVSDFTVFFNGLGIPHGAAFVKLAADLPITVDTAGDNSTLLVLQETGFAQ